MQCQEPVVYSFCNKLYTMSNVQIILTPGDELSEKDFPKLRQGNIILKRYSNLVNRSIKYNSINIIEEVSRAALIYNCGIPFGIKITSQILLFCGFTQPYPENKPNIYQLHVIEFLFHEEYGICVCDDNNILFGTKHYKHVHELQNLFFWLTGIEIETVCLEKYFIEQKSDGSKTIIL